MEFKDWADNVITSMVSIASALTGMYMVMRRKGSRKPEEPASNGGATRALVDMAGSTSKVLQDMLAGERHEHMLTNQQLDVCRSSYNELYKRYVDLDARVQVLEEELKQMKGD